MMNERRVSTLTDTRMILDDQRPGRRQADLRALLAPLGESRLWFVINTQETAGDRARLTLAHELGHAVMHRWIPTRDEKRDENDAFTFATALMLPPEEFNRKVPRELTLSRARDLKRGYWISIQSIVLTAHARGLITNDRYQSLYRQISARGWRHDEPEAIPLEQPTVWNTVLDIHRAIVKSCGFGNEE
jgi:Zn-dependent peptidase ImmA (M78 family)